MNAIRTAARSLFTFLLITACAGDSATGPQHETLGSFDLGTGGACPSDFSLILVKVGGEYDSIDRNQDGYVCRLLVDASNTLIEQLIDNHIPENQIGTCPGQFTQQLIKAGDPTDKNGNFIVCAMQTPQRLIVIDDNHQT